MFTDFEERKKELAKLVALPLNLKVQKTVAKLMEFYNRTDGNCYLSCSGGADSMVLYDICKKLEMISPKYKIKVVFDDTGLEEPSVRATALAIPNVEKVEPTMNFGEVITNFGYPIVSKEVSECVDQARKFLDNQGRERYI